MIRFTYRVGEEIVEVPVNVRRAIATYLTMKFGGNSVSVNDVALHQDGLELSLDQHTYAHLNQFGWKDFWPKVEHLGANGRISGPLACRVWSVFTKTWMDKEASFVLARIRRGELTFDQVLERYPLLFKHKDVQEALTMAWVAGTLEKPPAVSLERDKKWLLYAMAVDCTWTGKTSSLEAGYRLACESHKELLPPNYSHDIEDYAQTLARHVRRNFAKDPQKCLLVKNPADKY
ncbi:MAG TPA: hypothetical protein PKZ35_08815 [Gammaproteobacteria bacterium]|nr:hypothetical protein [Gammaproteobacteria bacterium]